MSQDFLSEGVEKKGREGGKEAEREERRGKGKREGFYLAIYRLGQGVKELARRKLREVSGGWKKRKEG